MKTSSSVHESSTTEVPTHIATFFLIAHYSFGLRSLSSRIWSPIQHTSSTLFSSKVVQWKHKDSHFHRRILWSLTSRAQNIQFWGSGRCVRTIKMVRFCRKVSSQFDGVLIEREIFLWISFPWMLLDSILSCQLLRNFLNHGPSFFRCFRLFLIE